MAEGLPRNKSEIDQAETLATPRKLAAAYADAVRAHFGERLRRIRLFGSAARGDWSNASDIDVLVLLDRITSEDTEWLVRQGLRMGILSQGILLQPIPMAESQFRHLLDRERAFALEVERYGIDL